MTLCVVQNDKEESQNIQNLNAMIDMNASGKLVKIKEESGLLERLFVI